MSLLLLLFWSPSGKEQVFECLSGSQKKKEEPVAGEGMFQAHGGLFIFKALKMHLKQEGWNLQGDTAKRGEIHKLILQECHVRAAKSLSEGSLFIWQQDVDTRKSKPLTLISLLNQDLPFTAQLFRLCLCFKTP